jgi:hypothetical protein
VAGAEAPLQQVVAVEAGAAAVAGLGQPWPDALGGAWMVMAWVELQYVLSARRDRAAAEQADSLSAPHIFLYTRIYLAEEVGTGSHPA